MKRHRLKDDRGALERALNGTHAPLPLELRIALKDVDGVFRSIRHTMRVILYNRHRHGPHGAVSAFESVRGPKALDIVRAAHWYVRRRVEYWGIDPKEEGFCTKCRKVKLLEEFPVVSRCQSCVGSRIG